MQIFFLQPCGTIGVLVISSVFFDFIEVSDLRLIISYEVGGKEQEASRAIESHFLHSLEGCRVLATQFLRDQAEISSLERRFERLVCEGCAHC